MPFSVANLQLAYEDKIVVKNLNLTLPENKVIALIGPNGCCKSTLLKSLARLLKPLKGEITLKNQDIWQQSAKSYAQTLAFLPQHHLVPEGIKVRELVAYGRSPYLNLWGNLNENDKRIVEEAMQSTHVLDLADNLATDLSGGQQQRVFLAMTLAQDADIVLLDEPTTYLDLNHQAELMAMMRKLQQQGKTVLTVLHDLNQACRYCDYLVVMKKGQVITQGTPEEVMTPALLKEVFDLNVEIHCCPVSGKPMFVIK